MRRVRSNVAMSLDGYIAGDVRNAGDRLLTDAPGC